MLTERVTYRTERVIADARELSDALMDVEREPEREINPVVYRPKELQAAFSEGWPFVASLMRGPKIFLVGDEHELQRPVGDSEDTAAWAGSAGG